MSVCVCVCVREKERVKTESKRRNRMGELYRLFINIRERVERKGLMEGWMGAWNAWRRAIYKRKRLIFLFPPSPLNHERTKPTP